MTATENDRPEDASARLSFWEDVHGGKDVDSVSWWQSVPSLSLDLVDRTGVTHDAGVIDVGAGWSTLVDHLVERGFTDVSAIDLSETALQTVRDRLSPSEETVTLTVADVLSLDLRRTFEVWHDRAVFHFLTKEDEREDYRASLDRHTGPGAWAVITTFGPAGPTTCSGLPAVRYTHEALAAEFPGWELVDTAGDDHQTPWGTVQQFAAVLLRKPDEGTARR
ncbi:class I SAM-dependent methyltransferase [Nocardioides kribbensis]|uniref:Class I SAM-dependent methyltransferase n=1 Tax=Nocardioides kribbensis TaxID=305517 RepID=A0ABV1NT84_9ACTN